MPPTSFKKTFPNPKVPLKSIKVGTKLFLLSFTPDKDGKLIVQGFDPCNDKAYTTHPIVPEDWR